MEFTPPPLNELVTIRNPGERPVTAVDQFGRPTSAGPTWGVSAYAHRRDRTPSSSLEESLVVYQLVSIFTIRELADIAADAEGVDQLGAVFGLIGPPVRRGGVGYGSLARYLELHTVWRGETT